jgi:hypothetical protein
MSQKYEDDLKTIKEIFKGKPAFYFPQNSKVCQRHNKRPSKVKIFSECEIFLYNLKRYAEARERKEI